MGARRAESETRPCFVLFNGFEFWVSPGHVCRNYEDATPIPEEDVWIWLRRTRPFERNGFYPVLVGVEAWLSPFCGGEIVF